jgi:archaellum component FlaG (FlaF/FlaG flagellin family)
MEAKVLAAVLAFAVLVGIGIGWQLPRREASPVTLERALTVTETVTAVRTVTWTVFPGEVRTTVTVTKSLGPLLKLLIPAGTYNCNSSELLVAVTVANAGDKPATVDLGRFSFSLKGVREENRTVMGPSIPQDQVTLMPGEDARLTIFFKVTDDAELSRYVRRSQFGTPILSLNLTIPYSWRGGSSELKLDSVFLGVLGDCKPAFLG